MIKAIVAIDKNRGMANDKGIPWKIPKDIEYFRQKTATGSILMGYGTYKEFKHPFHNHLNYVATTKEERLREGFEPVQDARQFLKEFDKDIWVIGGAGLLAGTLDLIDELYITQIDSDYNCTKFFPEFKNGFKLVSESSKQIENSISFTFQVWKRLQKQG